MNKRRLILVLILVLALAPTQLVTARIAPADNLLAALVSQEPTLRQAIANSPPEPPLGERRPIVSPEELQAANFLPNVPASTWAFGCGATAASMIAGYYDRTAYSNMYAGPTNGGVFPLTNSIWGTTVISGEVRALNPLSATRDGLDGRSGYGHIDDFWVSLVPGDADDPYITGGWDPHPYGDCTADYMKTNQSEYFNKDGWTTIHFMDDGSPATAAVLESYSADDLDGGYGLMTFYESRGYFVNTMFNQWIYGHNGNTLGFTWDQYKDQIDRGNPVMIFLEGPGGGHFMTALGYNDTGQTIYIHDTWDHQLHQMTWGSTYGGMTHSLVTVIELDPPPACSTQTYHTLTPDGALVDWCRDTEQLQVDTRPDGPIPGDQKLLLTWDPSNFYLGWDGANWDYGADLWLYFFSQDGQGTARSVSGAHTLLPDTAGGGADHALLVSGADPPVYSFFEWTGTWSPDLSFTGAVSITGDHTEVKMPRVELGITGSEPLALVAFSVDEGDQASWVSFPTDNRLGTVFVHAYRWGDTGAGITPNEFSIIRARTVCLPLVTRH
jgi:hypothetical protein